MTNSITRRMKAGMPIPPTILKYAPIPTALAMEWAQYSQQSRISPEQVQKMQAEMQKLQEQNKQLNAKLHDKSEELLMERQSMEAEFKLKSENQQFEHNLKMIELRDELAIKNAEASHKRQMEEIKVSSETSARTHEIIQKGANEASANVMK